MPDDPHTGVNGGTWSAPPEHLLRALRQPVLAALPGLAVVAVGGADAKPFLNGQLTVDVAALDAQRWQLGAYCSAKGRVLALFEMWQDEQGYGLLLPSEQAEPLRTRLSRYVLRSKVRLQEVGGQWSVFGLTGPGIEQALQQAGLTCPAEPWTCHLLDGAARLIRVPPSPRSGARLMLMAPASYGAAWRQKLSAVSSVEPGVWWWSKIDAGLPDVFGVTQERFVPQMLNLDVLGAVHFSKGCYPGQEVVARSQYLGKLRRRMFCGNAQSASAGDDVFGDDEGAGPVGTVVMAAASPAGGCDLLIECPSELAQSGRLRIGDARSAALSLSDPPYPMINPTA
jgi:tRNA-modifying protein YgfZ